MFLQLIHGSFPKTILGFYAEIPLAILSGIPFEIIHGSFPRILLNINPGVPSVVSVGILSEIIADFTEGIPPRIHYEIFPGVLQVIVLGILPRIHSEISPKVCPGVPAGACQEINLEFVANTNLLWITVVQLSLSVSGRSFCFPSESRATSSDKKLSSATPRGGNTRVTVTIT